MDRQEVVLPTAYHETKHYSGEASFMADKVRRIDYYYATVPDRPGEGLKVLSALRNAGILLLAYHAFPLGGGRAQVDLIAEDGRKLKQATDAAGIALTGPKRAFMVTGDDRVGAAAEHTKKLADTKINITAVTAVGAGSGRYGMIVWVASADYERAAAALGA
jgi:hypothetical protein